MGQPFNHLITIVYCTNSITEFGHMRAMVVEGLQASRILDTTLHLRTISIG